jgi:hypothetical protein
MPVDTDADICFSGWNSFRSTFQLPMAVAIAPGSHLITLPANLVHTLRILSIMFHMLVLSKLDRSHRTMLAQ